MAYQLTPWGYEVDGGLPPLIGIEDFIAQTDGRWADDPRVEGAVYAASAAIRSACGWHVGPRASCRVTLDTDGGHRLWVPASMVLDVTALTVDGESVDFEWSQTGLVVASKCLPRRLRGATIEYVAGVCDDYALTSLALGIANRALALTPGVTQETAGSVSVSYAQSAAVGGVVPYLTDHELAAIAPYKVVTAHAT